jgi:hypothetical protein
MFKGLVSLAVAVAAFVPVSVTTAQAQRPIICEPEMTAKLDELKVDRATVTSLYASHVRTLEGGSAGITGWATLNTCRGKVVFNMGSTCRVYETYTMGECRVPGLRNW